MICPFLQLVRLPLVGEACFHSSSCWRPVAVGHCSFNPGVGRYQDLMVMSPLSAETSYHYTILYLYLLPRRWPILPLSAARLSCPTWRGSASVIGFAHHDRRSHRSASSDFRPERGNFPGAVSQFPELYIDSFFLDHFWPRTAMEEGAPQPARLIVSLLQTRLALCANALDHNEHSRLDGYLFLI